MCAQTDRLSNRQLKAVKSEDKDYVLTDGDGLQLRARINRSMQWGFSYRHPVTKNRINIALGSYPGSLWRKLDAKRLMLVVYLREGLIPRLSAIISRGPS